MLKRAGRRLLVSPWFAAGAGVVIATGAVIYMPHPQLNPEINVTPCKLVICKQLAPQVIKPLQIGPGERVTPSPSPASVLAGMTFSYQVLDQSPRYGFSMLITIRAPQSLGQWKLSFAIPYATGVYVAYGALWQQAGTHGGTASNYYGSTESAAYAQISGHDYGGADSGSSRSGDSVTFQVRGSGTPSAPANCFYNGETCQFTLSHNSDGTTWSGSRAP